MISFLLFLFFSHHIHSAGFAGHTLLLTKHSQKTFEAIDANTLVQSYKNTFQPVLFLGKQSIAKVVQLNIADELITCHKKQLFWCVNKNDWACAKDLLLGDVLQTINEQFIVIDAVSIIEQQTELYSLTVGPPHYLYVGKYNVLAHNIAWFVGIGIEVALECGTIEFIKASVTFVVGIIALHFAKNKNKKKPKTSVTIASSCKSPQIDPDDENKKQGLIYERSDAHRKNQKVKSLKMVKRL